MNEPINLENVTDVTEASRLLSEEPILPDEEDETNAAVDDDDFFADDDGDLEGLTGDEKPEASTPTTEQKPEATPTESTEGTETGAETPTTEESPATETPSGKLRFKARVDHEDIDAEIDESDLPMLYQKATATDRYQAKLAKVNPLMDRLERMAKNNGYETVEDMVNAQETYDRENAIEELVKQGTPKAIAEDYVDRKFGNTGTPASKPSNEQAPTSAETTPVSKPGIPEARDFAAEVQALWSMRPDLKGTKIPSEVAAAAANGQNLSLAYFAYEAKQAKASAETLRKENEIFKQNAAAAAKAPVKGTAGGGTTDTKAKDPFEEGFDSGW